MRALSWALAGVACAPWPGAPDEIPADDTARPIDSALPDESGDTDTGQVAADTAPDRDGDGHPRSVDCDDADPAVHPGALDERCDGADQDCSGDDAPGRASWTPSDGGAPEDLTAALTGAPRQDAQHALSRPGTLHLCPGTWHLRLEVHAPTTLIGRPGLHPVVFAASDGPAIRASQALSVSGITVSLVADGIEADAESLVVEDVVFEGQGVGATAMLVVGQTDLRAERVVVRGVGRAVRHRRSGPGEVTSEVVLRDCVLEDLSHGLSLAGPATLVGGTIARTRVRGVEGSTDLRVEGTRFDHAGATAIDVPGGAAATVLGATFIGGGVQVLVGARGRAIVEDTTLAGADDSALWVSRDASLTMARVTASGNVARSHGGGAYVVEGQATALTCVDCLFEDNSGVSGGAVYAGAGATVSLPGSRFVGNHAAAAGGALYAHRVALDLATTTFTDNVAGGDGGAVYLTETRLLTPRSLTLGAFDGNAAGGRGGALAAPGGALTALGGMFVGNHAGADGGAIFAGALVALDGSTLRDNVADGFGGALALGDLSAGAAVVDALVQGNLAGAGGGAVWSPVDWHFVDLDVGDGATGNLPDDLAGPGTSTDLAGVVTGACAAAGCVTP